MKANLLILMITLFFLSCGNNANKKQTENVEDDGTEQSDSEPKELTEEEMLQEDIDHHIKENGIIKLEIDGKKLEWSCQGGETFFDKTQSLQFNYTGGSSDQYSAGDLEVKNTLIVVMKWKDTGREVKTGEYEAEVGFKNEDESYFYMNNPKTKSFGTLKITKVTKIDDYYSWIEGELTCNDLHMVKAESTTPSHSSEMQMSGFKVHINNRCMMYKGDE